jgi:hypothetical protein
VVSVHSITRAVSASSRVGLGSAVLLVERSRTSGASSVRLHRVSSHRRTCPTSCFSHPPRASDDPTPGTVYVAGPLLPAWFQCFLTKEAGTAVLSSLGDCSSFASLSQYCILTGNGRAGKLHDGAPLIGIDAVTYRVSLSESPRGSGYELAVLICLPLG